MDHQKSVLLKLRLIFRPSKSRLLGLMLDAVAVLPTRPTTFWPPTAMLSMTMVFSSSSSSSLLLLLLLPLPTMTSWASAEAQGSAGDADSDVSGSRCCKCRVASVSGQQHQVHQQTMAITTRGNVATVFDLRA